MHILADYSDTYHEVTETYHQHFEELSFLYAKVADLEDRSKRNNIKFRGILETVKPPYLIYYIQ